MSGKIANPTRSIHARKFFKQIPKIYTRLPIEASGSGSAAIMIAPLPILMPRFASVPILPDCTWNEVWLYEAKGEHLPAIRDLGVAIERGPGLVQAHFGRAIAYQANGQPDLSIADMNNAMRLDRNMVAALQMQRGNELRAARRYDEAIAAFDRTIDINARWPLAYFGRAASFDGKGDSERAAADYRKCIELPVTSDLERQRQREARERLDRMGAR